MRSLSLSVAKKGKESGADIIELRIDLLKEKERRVEKMKEFVEKVKKNVNRGIIATNRRREEGGFFEGSEEERIGMLSSVTESVDVDAVDIEFFAPRDYRDAIVEKAKIAHIPIIFSYHHFGGMPMPARADILKIIADMYEQGGDIAKMALTPLTLSEALILLDITQKISSEGKALATIGMGDIGKHLRLIAPIYGSVLTYGFIEEEGGGEVAPGQFSVKELRSMLDKLYPGKSQKASSFSFKNLPKHGCV
jgi:3-dehydroquinate dehydratase-1